MSDLSFLSQCKRPWVSTTQKILTLKDVKSGFQLLVLDAALMTNLTGLYREFVKILKFPAYFGKNFNALDECINDLEWISANGYLLYLRNSARLLCEENDEVLEGLLSILNNAGEEWANPISAGYGEGRDGVPFHTVLELHKTEIMDFLSRLQGVDFEVPNI